MTDDHLPRFLRAPASVQSGHYHPCRFMPNTGPLRSLPFHGDLVTPAVKNNILILFNFITSQTFANDNMYK